MTHEDILNKILSEACGIFTAEEVRINNGYQRFRIETHCKEYFIEAKAFVKDGKFQWEIRSLAE